MCLHQRETLPVVAFAAHAEGVDLEVEAIDETKELSEDAAGGVAVDETAHCQRIALVANPGSVAHARKAVGSVFRFVVVEAVRVGFVTVVGVQVEIVVDLHLLGEHIERVLLEKRVPDGFDRVKIELRSKVT